MKLRRLITLSYFGGLFLMVLASFIPPNQSYSQVKDTGIIVQPAVPTLDTVTTTPALIEELDKVTQAVKEENKKVSEGSKATERHVRQLERVVNRAAKAQKNRAARTAVADDAGSEWDTTIDITQGPPEEPVTSTGDAPAAPPNFFQRLGNRIKSIFKRK